MADAQYISVREAAKILCVTERTIMDLIEKGDLKAYKIANQFLRLKKNEVLGLQKQGEVKNETVQFPYTLKERIGDFFAFNDLYLASIAIVIILVFTILL